MSSIQIQQYNGNSYTNLVPKESINATNSTNASNSDTLDGYHAQYFLDEINSLKTSVSNGKATIAGAITDKRISTSASDSFQTMANNIKLIKNYEISINSWQKNSGSDLVLPFSNIPIERILIASTSYSASYYGTIWLDISTQKWKAAVGRSDYNIGNYTLDGIVHGSGDFSGSGYIFNSVFIYK